MIHVCSLAALPETVKATGASHILTVMANVDQVQRPESVLEANHLKVQVDDITEEIEGAQSIAFIIFSVGVLLLYPSCRLDIYE